MCPHFRVGGGGGSRPVDSVNGEKKGMRGKNITIKRMRGERIKKIIKNRGNREKE
jgi:hypothetical protein